MDDFMNGNNKYSIYLCRSSLVLQGKALAGNRGACCKYPVMGMKDIINLPVNKISDTNCVLFLWITMPQLMNLNAVLYSWNFNYKTVAFTWVKKNKKANSWFMGMGNWTRANAELCVLATKGKPKRISASVRSIIDTPIEGHSKKPDIVRDKIVELCGDLPRIELFARKRVKGWDAWGNEV